MTPPGRRMCLAPVLTLYPIARASAQWPPEVVAGARVQVRLPEAGLVNELDDDSDLSFGEAALLGGGVGVAIGAVVGAIRPEERWRRVRLGVVVPAPH